MGDSPHDSVSLLRIHDPSFPTSRTNQHRRLGNNDPRLIYIYIFLFSTSTFKGVTNGSPYTTIRDLQPGHPFKVQVVI